MTYSSYKSLHLQEAGLARILLPDLGLESVMRIDRPIKPGEQLDVCLSFVDVPKGSYKFSEATALQSRYSQSLDSADVSLELPDENTYEVEDDADSVAVADSSPL